MSVIGCMAQVIPPSVRNMMICTAYGMLLNEQDGLVMCSPHTATVLVTARLNAIGL